MRAALLPLLLLLGCWGDPQPPIADPPTPGAWREGVTRTGATRVRWRPAQGPIPLNRYFELEVELERAGDGTPLEGADLFVRCEMPAHGHGMNVEPRAREVGAGRYRVEGLLLHMAGEWVLGVDVVVDRHAESAEFPLTLE